MGEPEYSVVLFYSTSGGIRGEKLAKEEGLKVKLIPVPRHLSSDCGVCVRIERANREAAVQALKIAGVEIEEIHEI